MYTKYDLHWYTYMYISLEGTYKCTIYRQTLYYTRVLMCIRVHVHHSICQYTHLITIGILIYCEQTDVMTSVALLATYIFLIILLTIL